VGQTPGLFRLCELIDWSIVSDLVVLSTFHTLYRHTMSGATAAVTCEMDFRLPLDSVGSEDDTLANTQLYHGTVSLIPWLGIYRSGSSSRCWKVRDQHGLRTR
jgi:hypothetical protein